MTTITKTERVTIGGHDYDYDAVVNLMDDEIREALHGKLDECTPQDFADAYCEAHRAKYGADFAVN